MNENFLLLEWTTTTCHFKAVAMGCISPNTPLYRACMCRIRMLLCSSLCGSNLGNSIELGSASEVRLIRKITSFMGTWGVSQEILQNTIKVRSKKNNSWRQKEKEKKEEMLDFQTILISIEIGFCTVSVTWLGSRSWWLRSYGGYIVLKEDLITLMDLLCSEWFNFKV